MTDAPVFTIAAGETTPIWEVGYRTSEEGATLELADLDGNFTCQLKVRGTMIDRLVSAKTGDNQRFRAWLTPAETATLPPGRSYVVGVQIRNPTLVPPIVLEQQLRLVVESAA